jgi:hypothetical protein
MFISLKTEREKRYLNPFSFQLQYHLRHLEFSHESNMSYFPVASDLFLILHQMYHSIHALLEKCRSPLKWFRKAQNLIKTFVCEFAEVAIHASFVRTILLLKYWLCISLENLMSALVKILLTRLNRPSWARQFNQKVH